MLCMPLAPPVTPFPDQRPEPTLGDFLNGYVGVEGSTEALSERCGERFTEGLAEAGRGRVRDADRHRPAGGSQ